MSSKVPFILGKGWVHSRNLLYFYGVTREANTLDEYESVVLRWDAREWGLWQVPTRLCSVCSGTVQGERVIFCIGIDGYVEVSDKDGVRSEVIDPSRDGPDRLKHITFVRPIEGQIIAVGMSRMVYRRSMQSPGWQRADDGTRVLPDSTELAGFKSIDGDGRGRYIAAGFHGDLWLYEDGRWRQLDSPTNAKLESVRWVTEDLVFVAGAGGILLHGRPDSLGVLMQSRTKHTFWSIEWYRDELYLATRNNSLWVLRNDDLEPVQLPCEKAVTTGWLHANDDVLLSVGDHDMMLFDGCAWKPLDAPPPDSDWPLQW